MTKEYPIIFNDDMLQAILDGRKTQTRRIPSKANAKWKVGDRLLVKVTYFGGWQQMKCPKVTLEIVGLKTERLQFLLHGDCLDEGFIGSFSGYSFISAEAHFSAFWDKLHTKEGERWEDNPEVLVVKFRRVE